jgi:regulator of protease activity HflC (stomatin/prohibitin superfamily)
MQAQITAEREKRAMIATSEGEKQKEINLAEGSKQSDILQSEGEKQAAINKAQGEATAAGIQMVADAIGKEGGMSAANLKIAEPYIGAFANLAKTSNTLIVPSDVPDVAGVVASAMSVLEKTRQVGVSG